VLRYSKPQRIDNLRREPEKAFISGCLRLPAADIPSALTAGTSTTATSVSAMIARRSGCPADVDQWEWGCGFYPGTEPGQGESGTAADFEASRVEFEAAWKRLLPMLTEASFQEWRDQRAWTAEKYAMWDHSEKMPTQKPNSIMPCPCGARFDSHDPAGSYVHRLHIYAAQAADGIRR
jgi:hypothetical protein